MFFWRFTESLNSSLTRHWSCNCPRKVISKKKFKRNEKFSWLQTQKKLKFHENWIITKHHQHHHRIQCNALFCRKTNIISFSTMMMLSQLYETRGWNSFSFTFQQTWNYDWRFAHFWTCECLECDFWWNDRWGGKLKVIFSWNGSWSIKNSRMPLPISAFIFCFYCSYKLSSLSIFFSHFFFEASGCVRQRFDFKILLMTRALHALGQQFWWVLFDLIEFYCSSWYFFVVFYLQSNLTLHDNLFLKGSDQFLSNSWRNIHKNEITQAQNS
jgi:hypothetical protein